MHYHAKVHDGCRGWQTGLCFLPRRRWCRRIKKQVELYITFIVFSKRNACTVQANFFCGFHFPFSIRLVYLRLSLMVINNGAVNIHTVYNTFFCWNSFMIELNFECGKKCLLGLGTFGFKKYKIKITHDDICLFFYWFFYIRSKTENPWHLLHENLIVA